MRKLKETWRYDGGVLIRISSDSSGKWKGKVDERKWQK